MSVEAQVYDEVEIEDMDFDGFIRTFFYPCPCGDKFQISLEDIGRGYSIAKCPSCSLTIRVVYDAGSFEEYQQVAQELEAE